MIPKIPRDLLSLRLDLASKTLSAELAWQNINRAIGMLDYALGRGDLTPQEHATELAWVELVKSTWPDPVPAVTFNRH